jgi:hypothetical protein
MSGDQRTLNALVSRFNRLDEAGQTELIEEVTSIADAAWDKIKAGQGEARFVRSTGQNGKSVNLDPVMTVKETLALMEEVLEALDPNRGTTRITYLDLSEIHER